MTQTCQLDIEDDVPDLNDVDVAELPQPQDVSFFRRYLLALRRMESEIEQIKTLRDSISEKYDFVIDKKKEKAERFKLFLKEALVNSESLVTKTGGFKVEIPDVGTFSATKQSPDYSPGEDFMSDEAFMITPPPKFSREKFEDYLKKKLEAKEFILEGNKIINTVTGEIVDGVKVSFSRRFTFPKG
jgi:hypothetical protein